jgi:hypothetical protein
MIREHRYVVFKLKDMLEADLTLDEIRVFCSVMDKVNISRFNRKKPSLQCVVVEKDWPEYEVVWKMIEDRVNGNV